MKDAFVAWEDGRIVEVAPGRGERHYEGAMILPGLVNAHSHLEYAVYAGFGDGRVFGEWLGLHISRKAALGYDEMVAIARRGVADSLAAGITTTADYSFSGASAAAAAELGLRAIVYLEVFGSDPELTAQRFGELKARAPESEHVRIGVSPHAPYTCSLDVYRWCLSLGIPVGTHLAESAAEHEWLLLGTGALWRPTARCWSSRPGSARSRRSRTSSGPSSCAPTACTSTPTRSTCSRSATCPSRTARARTPCSAAAPRRSPTCAPPGIRVGLGTDSPASTPSFDAWEELRTAIYMSRAREQRPDTLEAASALRLATLDAARALGLDDQVGSLVPGKRADIAVLSVAGSPYDPVEDPEVAAVFGGSPAGILETIVDGTTRYRQGETTWQGVRSTASAARSRMLP